VGSSQQALIAAALGSAVATGSAIGVTHVGARTCGFQFTSAGVINDSAAGSATTNPPFIGAARGAWLLRGPASDFSVRLTYVSGPYTTLDTAGGSAAQSTYLNLGSTRHFWLDSDGSAGIQTTVYNAEIRRDSSGLVEGTWTLDFIMSN
jgi:hypothetical protein